MRQTLHPRIHRAFASALPAVLLALLLASCGGGGSRASDDAELVNLLLSDGTLDPGFDTNVTLYTVEVGILVGALTVTPSAADAGATIEVAGVLVQSGSASGPVSLTPGPTPIQVVVTAEDGATQRSYTIVVIRAVEVTQEAYLKASNAETLDGFGRSAAISGDTLVVGGIGEDSDGTSEADNSLSRSGAAYVFVRTGASWTQQAYLKASNADQTDFFGIDVAIEGDTIVVGAPLERSDGTGEANDSIQAAGAAYVFVRDGTSWSQQAYLKASNAGLNDSFGERVAISGNTIVIGAPGEASDGSSEADNSANSAGAVYVFARSGTSWPQQAYLKASNPDPDDQFGSDVDIDRDTIVVGAHHEESDGSSETDNSASRAGAVYVFARSGTTWTQEAYLKHPAPEAFADFGHAVAVSGSRIATSVRDQNGPGCSFTNNETVVNGGAVFVFERRGIIWTQDACLRAVVRDDGDALGFAPGRIAFEGDLLVVSARGDDSDGSSEFDNSAENSGAIYLFVRSGSTWTQELFIKASNAEDRGFLGDDFGAQVGLSGDTIVAGAPAEDSDGSSELDNSAESAGAAFVHVLR